MSRDRFFALSIGPDVMTLAVTKKRPSDPA
jgi:hypothetical protein